MYRGELYRSLPVSQAKTKEKGKRKKEKGKRRKDVETRQIHAFLPDFDVLSPFAKLLLPLCFCTKPNLCKPLRNRIVKKEKGKSRERAETARVGGMTAASRCRTRSGAPSAISSSVIECCPSRRHSAFGRPDRGTATLSFFLSPFSQILCTQSEAKLIERRTARAACSW